MTPNDSGALASMNLLGNSIGVEQAQEFLRIKEQKGMSTLCGLTGSEKELGLSNSSLSVGCAVLLSPELEDNEALASLNLANNKLGAEGAQHLAKVLPTW